MAFESILHHFREVVHSPVHVAISAKSPIKFVLDEVKKAAMAVRKEVAVQKGSFSRTLDIAFPKQLFADPLNRLPQPRGRLVELFLVGEAQRNRAPTPSTTTRWSYTGRVLGS